MGFFIGTTLSPSSGLLKHLDTGGGFTFSATMGTTGLL